MKRIVRSAVAAFAVTTAFAAPALAAQGNYPSRPVTIVVPFAAGGIADALPRIVGEQLAKTWGQPVIVENRAGASGNIGMAQVARAAGDGYTLGLAPAGNLTVNPVLYTNLGFDTARDFAPITLIATSPNVLVVHPKVPAKSFSELVEYARANPDRLNFASPGAGSGAHLAGELLNQSAGIDTQHIPYGGMAPALQDVLGGNVDMMFAGISTVLPHIEAGRLIPLAVAGPERVAALPEVPTVAESGYPGFDVTSWYGLVAPSAVPAEVIGKIQQDVAEVLEQPEIAEKFAGLGVTPAANNTPEEFAAMIDEEGRKWAEIVKQANIQPLQ